MKTFFTTDKWKTGLIIFLIITNISTIATIVWHRYFRQAQNIVIDRNDDSIPNPHFNRYLCTELGLTPEQHQFFRQLQHEYKDSTRLLSIKLNEYRDQMLLELETT